MQRGAVGDCDIELADEAIGLEVFPAFAFEKLERAAIELSNAT